MASRFWVAQPISAIADNGSGKCRCTVSTTTGMTNGGTVYFANMTGTTGLGGAQTIAVIDGTHVDVVAVAFVATGTGGIHGPWDGTNTNNWAATSGTTPTGATAIPGTSDTVTFDSSSGGGSPIITIASSIGGTNTVQSITAQTFAGTLDFSVNNPSITVTTATGFTANGAGVKTIKFGTSAWTFNSGASLDISNANTTVTCGAASFTFNATTVTSQQLFGPSATNGSQFSSAAITFNGRTGGTGIALNSNAFSCASLTINGPAYVVPLTGGTTTIGTLTVTGTLSAPVYLGSNTAQSTTFGPWAVTSSTIAYTMLRGMVFSTSAVSPTNSWDLGNNNFNGGTLSAPSAGAAAGVIGS